MVLSELEEHAVRQLLALIVILGGAGFLGLAVSARAADAAEKKEPINFNMPEPCFGGRAVDYGSANLEPMDFRDRPPFLAPKGTSLISKGKTATSSVNAPLRGDLKMLVDGDRSCEDKSIVELEGGAQWVQVDLGAEHELFAIMLWHYRAEIRVYFDVIVQVSNDPEFKDKATTVFNNDFDNSSGRGVGTDKEYFEGNKGRLIDAKGVTARYIRSYTNGNFYDELNHYVEIEVFGRPAK